MDAVSNRIEGVKDGSNLRLHVARNGPQVQLLATAARVLGILHECCRAKVLGFRV